MSLRARVIAMALIGLIALGVAGVVVGSRFFEARSAANEVATNLQPAADAADSLVVSIEEMDRGLLEYILSQKATSLDAYAEGVTQSLRSIGTLNEELKGSEEGFEEQLADVTTAREQWITTVARPAINHVREGNQAKATELIGSVAATQSFAILEQQATYLQSSIDDKRTEVFEQLNDFTRQLAIALVATGVVLLIGLLAAILLLTIWVLRPLDHLSRQLRGVAQEGLHETPIEPSGPPELTSVGEDAEEMRRQLVTEIDEARMAREGLEQDAPVVAAIRAELTRDQVGYAPGLDIFGDLQPAEGVLAGDWWDLQTLRDGRTAIMLTDVSGHGPKAGIAGLRAKLTFKSVLENGGTAIEAMKRGAELFAETPDRFATVAIVIIDPHQKQVEWVNAGHIAPALLNASGQHRNLEVTGPLLSTLGGTWTSKKALMADDDILLLWTDGISESHDADGTELEESEGVIPMVASVRSLGAVSPKQLVPAVLARARNRAVDWRRDDVTLIAVRLSTTQ